MAPYQFILFETSLPQGQTHRSISLLFIILYEKWKLLKYILTFVSKSDPKYGSGKCIKPNLMSSCVGNRGNFTNQALREL